MTLPIFFALLGLVSLWGSAFPLIKVGLEGLGPGHLTLLRHLVASLCFLPFLALSRQRLFPEHRDLLGFLLLGSVGIGLYHLTLNAGELRVSAGASSLIISAAPAISALLARFTLGERLPLLGWVGSFISFGGIAIIVLGDSATLGLDPFALLVLVAALCTSVYMVAQKPFLLRYRATEVTAFATWGATVPLLLFLPGLFSDAADAPQSALAAVYLGIFPSAIAYSLLSFALSRSQVSLVGVYLYTIPVFALLFSWLLLEEVPTLLTLVGGVVAIAGIVLVNVVKARSQRGIRMASTVPGGVPAAVPRRPHR